MRKYRKIRQSMAGKYCKICQWDSGKKTWISSICCKTVKFANWLRGIKSQNLSVGSKKKNHKFRHLNCEEKSRNLLINWKKIPRNLSIGCGKISRNYSISYVKKKITKILSWSWKKIVKFFSWSWEENTKFGNTSWGINSRIHQFIANFIYQPWNLTLLYWSGICCSIKILLTNYVSLDKV